MNGHDKTGRSTGQHHNSRIRKAQGPPRGARWIWLTEEMLISPAWRTLNAIGMSILTRVVLEHLYHGGRENGRLVVTYSDLESFGARRQSIAVTLDVLVALGWLDVVEKGGRSWADIRRPSRYALTWLPRADGTPASNKWKTAKDLAAATAIVRRAQHGYKSRLEIKKKRTKKKVASIVGTVPIAA